jgi:hypothetical protein
MTLVVSALPVAQTRDERADAVRADIRKKLLQLPYYSVFDFLAFKYDRGTAVLMVMPTRRRSKRTQSTPSNACRVSTRTAAAVANGRSDSMARVLRDGRSK